VAIGIHARRRDGEWRYRLWTTESDEYFSEEMNLDELKEWMIDARYTPQQVRNGRMDEELTRLLPELHEHGGIGTGRTDDVDGPWKQERCETCGKLHHEFQPIRAPWTRSWMDESVCSVCGEPAEDKRHAPPCV
jgi:hypothetical protein